VVVGLIAAKAALMIATIAVIVVAVAGVVIVEAAAAIALAAAILAVAAVTIVLSAVLIVEADARAEILVALAAVALFVDFAQLICIYGLHYQSNSYRFLYPLFSAPM
jgi:hypothetical protein